MRNADLLSIMGKSLDSSVKLLKQLYEIDWRTTEGFVVFSALILTCFFGLSKLDSPLINEMGQPIWYVLFFGWVIYWWLSRKLLIIGSGPVRMELAISSSNIFAQRHNLLLRKKLGHQIRELGLESQLTLVDLPPQKTFRSAAAASKYVEEKKINLLVWGEVLPSREGAQEVYEYTLHATHLFRGDASVKQEIKRDIALATSRPKWNVQAADSLSGMKVVSENLTEICIFILSRCLATVLEVEALSIADDLLDKLDTSLAGKSVVTFPKLQGLRKKTRSLKAEVNEKLAVAHGMKGQHRQALLAAKKSYDIEPSNFTLCVHLAVLSYYVGELSEAKRFTRKLKDLDPTSDLADLNEAFFSILDGDWSRYIQMRNRIRSLADTDVSNVIAFLSQEFAKHPSNLGIAYHRAWVMSKFGSKTDGQNELRKLLTLLAEDPTYSPLVEDAQRWLAADHT